MGCGASTETAPRRASHDASMSFDTSVIPLETTTAYPDDSYGADNNHIIPRGTTNGSMEVSDAAGVATDAPTETETAGREYTQVSPHTQQVAANPFVPPLLPDLEDPPSPSSSSRASKRTTESLAAEKEREKTTTTGTTTASTTTSTFGSVVEEGSPTHQFSQIGSPIEEGHTPPRSPAAFGVFQLSLFDPAAAPFERSNRGLPEPLAQVAPTYPLPPTHPVVPWASPLVDQLAVPTGDPGFGPMENSASTNERTGSTGSRPRLGSVQSATHESQVSSLVDSEDDRFMDLTPHAL